MSTTLTMISGEDKDFPLQCWNEGALTTPVFGPDDAMSAVVSPGDGQAQLFAPAVTWFTAPDPVTGIASQTGYAEAQVLVTVAAADSATLEPEAAYALEVWRQPAGSTVRNCVWRGRLVAGYAAGTSMPRLPTYCTYEDMLEWGPWVKYLPAASEQAAFYKPRLEARLWIDDLIVKSDRGGGLFPFGTAGVPYTQWSGWVASRKSPMPAVWTRDQLWGGFVNGPVTVTARGTGYLSEPAVTAPPPPRWALPQVDPRQEPAQFRAVLDGLGGVGAVVLLDAGFGYPPGLPLTLAFSGGGGTGAAATAAVSPGALLKRDQVRRLAAFKALSIVGLKQIGNNPQHVAFGQYFGTRCSEEIGSYVAELDINFDGWPDIAIPCYVTNTIYK